MIANGASVKQVQTILGHSTSRVTLDRYAHVYDDHADDLMSALDARHDVRRAAAPNGALHPRVTGR
jgi:site-specific recombinase XerD